MRGLADGLDPDSAFLSPGQVKAVEAGEAPPDGDVGIELTRRYYLYVIAARDGSPAQKAGLRTADTIRAIDGKPTRDMSVFEGTRALRGKAGTKVTLTIIRGNAADPHEVVLVRDKVAGPLVTSRLIGTTGYLRIVSFRNGVVEELRKQAARSGEERREESDRRRPPHGRRAARKRHRGRARLHQVRHARDQGRPRQAGNARAGDGRAPAMAQSIFRPRCSSRPARPDPGELFVAAMNDNDRAELIGERTLGRAGIQKLVKLPEGRGLWLTYARYLTPKGNPIQGRGLEPDVAVDDPDVEFGAPASDKDPILDAALERMKLKVAA